VIFGAVLGVLVSLCSVGAGRLGAWPCSSLSIHGLPPVRIVGSDLAHAVPLSLWPAWATGSSAAWIKEASRAVREYLMALDAARSDEESSGGDDSGASGGGSRRSAPKEVSLTDPQGGGMGRKEEHRPVSLLTDANYLIDNKAGIIVDAGSGAGRGRLPRGELRRDLNSCAFSTGGIHDEGEQEIRPTIMPAWPSLSGFSPASARGRRRDSSPRHRPSPPPAAAKPLLVQTARRSAGPRGSASRLLDRAPGSSSPSATGILGITRFGYVVEGTYEFAIDGQGRPHSECGRDVLRAADRSPLRLPKPEHGQAHEDHRVHGRRSENPEHGYRVSAP